VSRHKLKRFEEMKSFTNTFEYPVEMKGKWNAKVFVNDNPIVLELGCGRGEYTVGLSAMFPGKNFIGVDLKGARLWKGAKLCAAENRKNAAFIRSRIELIEHYFEKGEVSELWITFPDPQSRDKWEKKRLTSAGYLDLYRKISSPGGRVHLKTDSTFLYDYTLALVKDKGLVVEFFNNDIYATDLKDPALEIETTYERKFKLKGEKIKYLRFLL
jgi:tRNA (guanine-N7-)-methyltransferase